MVQQPQQPVEGAEYNSSVTSLSTACIALGIDYAALFENAYTTHVVPSLQNAGSCHVSTHNGNTGTGQRYISRQIYLNDSGHQGNVNVKLHHIVMFRTLGYNVDAWVAAGVANGSDVSHICNNSKCMRREHLVIEANLYNQSRLQCFMVGANRPQGWQLYVCLHVPRCEVRLL